MDIEKLKDYKEWIGKTPEEIIIAVKAIRGGWATVFPDTLPLFAHEVRNFFNIEPTSVTLLGRGEGGQYVNEVRKRFEDWGFVDTVKGILALSGDVYRDQSNRIWYQMSAGGTIYHWGGEPTWDIVDAGISNYVRKQDGVPIFKLISPDGTGGSAETIIRNQMRFTIGGVNETVPVRDRVVREYRHRGSYNYSETVEAGLPAHEKRDVAPHKKYPNYYLNYENPFSITLRRFSARRPDGKLIGYEIGMEPYVFDSTRPDPPRSVDRFAVQMSPPHYPKNDKRSIDLIKDLEYLFRSDTWPKRLLARIEGRSANDKAVKDFHNPAVIDPNTAARLLKILRDRP